jgi:CheY-like chemotaxis protein
VKILIVEDSVRNIQELEREIIRNYPAGTVTIAQSRDSAITVLEANWFDLVVLDRKLPTVDGALDEDVAHGAAVYAHIRTAAPGTPILFWTAFPDEEYFNQILHDARQENVFGAGELPMIRAIAKSRFDQLNQAIAEVHDALQRLQEVELRQRPGLEMDLTATQGRVLKVFARRVGGDAVEVAALTGGLSEAIVIRAAVFVGGRPLSLAVGKILRIDELRGEEACYQRFNRLGPGAAPAMVCQVRAGAAHLGGAFYQLAAGYDRSLFEVLSDVPDAGPEVVRRLRESTRSWAEAAQESRTSIREVRRLLVNDATFDVAQATLHDLDLAALETEMITWRRQCCHGDLHGENVLINTERAPILIDFGEANDLPAAWDPLTLELSAISHPGGLRRSLEWPTLEQIAQWSDINVYLQDCPYAGYIRACREWAFEVAPGNRTLYAVAYCYGLRQFKYPDTDKAAAEAIVRATVAAYRRYSA